MTIIDIPADAVPRLVTVDLYRDIHKGIRAELFAITGRAGSLDPASTGDRGDLAAHVRRVLGLLVSHAEHEDVHVQPAIERHLPDLAERIEADHERLEQRIVLLAEQADDASVATGDHRLAMHRLHLDLAAFTASYLAHQDLEERHVMPALEDAVGAEATAAMEQAIVGSIPPDEMGRSLAVMLPAMNVDDRTELLAGIRAGAPAEAFAGVWDLACSVLADPDVRALADNLSR